LPALHGAAGLADQAESAGVWELPVSGLADGRHHLPGYAQTLAALVSGQVVGDDAEERRQRVGTAAHLGTQDVLDGLDPGAPGLHKLRRALVRPGRDCLAGTVEVDETYWGGEEAGVVGRLTYTKTLIIVAAQQDGQGIGRIRLGRIPDLSQASLHGFIAEAVAPGSIVVTDGLNLYAGLRGYVHRPIVVKRAGQTASTLLPRVHRVISLLKRWLLGTHPGAVRPEHLEYYLDEFTFRFNRRRSAARGKLFYRLMQQAAQIEATPYRKLIKHVSPGPKRPRCGRLE